MKNKILYSTHKKNLNGKTPDAATHKAYDDDVMKALLCKPINPDEVNLTPKPRKYNH